MVAEELRRAIQAAPRLGLDALARVMWEACATARISEAEAVELADLIEVCRTPPVARVPRTGSRPKTSESLTRRRRVAACGRLPPSLACHFTQGEVAVLAIVATDAMQEGTCTACIASIGDRAGVSRTTVKNALRHAKALELITVEERRQTYWRNLTNVVTIVSPEWNAWNRLAPKAKDPKARDSKARDSKARDPKTKDLKARDPRSKAPEAGMPATGLPGSRPPEGGGKSSTGSNTFYKRDPETRSKTHTKSCRKGEKRPEGRGSFETPTPCTPLGLPKPTGTGG